MAAADAPIITGGGHAIDKAASGIRKFRGTPPTGSELKVWVDRHVFIKVYTTPTQTKGVVCIVYPTNAENHAETETEKKYDRLIVSAFAINTAKQGTVQRSIKTIPDRLTSKTAVQVEGISVQDHTTPSNACSDSRDTRLNPQIKKLTTHVTTKRLLLGDDGTKVTFQEFYKTMPSAATRIMEYISTNVYFPPRRVAGGIYPRATPPRAPSPPFAAGGGTGEPYVAPTPSTPLLPSASQPSSQGDIMMRMVTWLKNAADMAAYAESDARTDYTLEDVQSLLTETNVLYTEFAAQVTSFRPHWRKNSPRFAGVDFEVVVESVVANMNVAHALYYRWVKKLSGGGAASWGF